MICLPFSAGTQVMLRATLATDPLLAYYRVMIELRGGI